MYRKRFGRRKFVQYGASGVAAAGVIGLVGCGDDDADETPAPTPGGNGATPGTTPDDGDFELAAEQVLRTRFYFDLLPLDPARIFGIEQENTAIAVYSGLTKYNTSTEIEPDLAESWEQPDPTTYVFNLAAAQWQKGYGEVTADDVVWSYERIMEGGGQYAAEFALIDSITALTDQSVEIKLKSPDANFPHQVANYHQGSVLNARAVEELGDDHWFSPVGSGPFMLEDVRPGQGFQLVRFDDYFKGPATLERIDMQTIADQNTAAISLRNGELDVLQAIRIEPPLDLLEEDPDMGFAVGEKWGIGLWIFNTTRPELSDPRVRQAMAHAIDFESIIEATAPRTQSLAYSIVPDWIPEYSDDIPRYPFDPGEAAALLEAAGYSDGIQVEFMALGNPNEMDQLIQASLAQAGIDLSFDITDRAQFNSRRVSGDHDITLRGYPAANIDQILLNYLHPDNIVPNGFNGSRYDEPEVTEAMLAARSAVDEEERMERYAFVQQKVMEDLPYLPIRASNEYWPYRISKVKGLAVNRMPQGNWYDISIANT